eukprot:TRINITY_DN30214_c0_g1_i1.p1 TRINITY_DN30214_c0_g1~~TRINITY_DN30214_c0_g1_i1.p1  ORF type:complete len:118 (-),score=12.46 TRINITY_DN30214_c0_g1_i1:409-762(-)
MHPSNEGMHLELQALIIKYADIRNPRNESKRRGIRSYDRSSESGSSWKGRQRSRSRSRSRGNRKYRNCVQYDNDKENEIIDYGTTLQIEGIEGNECNEDDNKENVQLLENQDLEEKN